MFMEQCRQSITFTSWPRLIPSSTKRRVEYKCRLRDRTAIFIFQALKPVHRRDRRLRDKSWCGPPLRYALAAYGIAWYPGLLASFQWASFRHQQSEWSQSPAVILCAHQNPTHHAHQEREHHTPQRGAYHSVPGEPKT